MAVTTLLAVIRSGLQRENSLPDNDPPPRHIHIVNFKIVRETSKALERSGQIGSFSQSGS
jgi:hypothetical protein